MLTPLFAAITTIVAATTLGGWLDATPLANWNTSNTLPARPGARAPELAPGGQCASSVRPPSSIEDKLVVARGWSLVGPYQRWGRTSIVSGMGAADGMCRPSNYQSFVFVNGTFTGTLSPHLMQSREDGSIQSLSISLWNATDFNVDYSRYSPDDPLCCPHGTTSVEFQLKPVNGRLRPVPVSANTQKNPK